MDIELIKMMAVVAGHLFKPMVELAQTLRKWGQAQPALSSGADALSGTFAGTWKGPRVPAVGVPGERAQIETTLQLANDLNGMLSYGTRSIECRKIVGPGVQGFERFLIVQYTNKDPAVRQMGVAFFHLSDDGERLSGTYAGYGPESQRVVAGEMRLHRPGKVVHSQPSAELGA